MPNSHPELHCGPLVLRLPHPDEAQELFALASDPELSRYLQWPAHRSVSDSSAYIADTHLLWERRTAFLPSIYERATGAMVGSIGISGIEWTHRRAELGTWIGIPWQGKGFNIPAKAAMFAFGFSVLQLHRLEMLARSDNQQSLAALRKLPGVRHEGTLHDRLWQGEQPYDAELFALTADRWLPREWPDATIPPGLP